MRKARIEMINLQKIAAESSMTLEDINKSKEYILKEVENIEQLLSASRQSTMSFLVHEGNRLIKTISDDVNQLNVNTLAKRTSVSQKDIDTRKQAVVEVPEKWRINQLGAKSDDRGVWQIKDPVPPWQWKRMNN